MEYKFGNSRIIIDPNKGAAIDELVLNGVQIIEVQEGVHYQSSLLFPFPNRLKGGRFEHNGQIFEFPLNDFGRPNALHGFLADKLFDVQQIEGGLRCTFDYNADESYYPFPFTLSIDYLLFEEELKMAVHITNRGANSMPCGFGWHPYFKVNGFDQSKLQMEPVRQIEVDENLIPTQLERPYCSFDMMKSISGYQLDTCFSFESPGIHKTVLELNKSRTIEIWQDVEFGYLQVYTPDDQRSLAIEPMTCNIDALNNRKDLKILSAAESWQLTFGVRLF